jgi:hypothetical protein
VRHSLVRRADPLPPPTGRGDDPALDDAGVGDELAPLALDEDDRDGWRATPPHVAMTFPD